MSKQNPISKYGIKVEQSGPEIIPVMITLPMEYFRENQDKVSSAYAPGNATLRALESSILLSYGIVVSPHFDWEGFLTREILPHSKDFELTRANRVKRIHIDDKKVTLECFLNPIGGGASG